MISGVPADVTIQCGQPLPFAPATCNGGSSTNCVIVTDKCDGSGIVPTFYEIYYAGDCVSNNNSNGKSRVVCTWTAKDACGNVAVKNWTITIANSTPISKIAQSFDSQLDINNKNTLLENEQREILISPNPTNGVVKINFGTKQVRKMDILDLSGRIIYSVDNIQNQVIDFDMSKQNVGLYIIKLDTDEGVVSKKLIVKE